MFALSTKLSEKRFWIGFLLGAISAGALYWLSENYLYLWSAIEHQFIPYDAFAILIPCVIVALLVSGAFGLPLIVYLAKRKKMNLASILISSGMLSTAAINLLHQSAPWEKPISIMVGLGAGLIFYLISGKHLIANPDNT